MWVQNFSPVHGTDELERNPPKNGHFDSLKGLHYQKDPSRRFAPMLGNLAKYVCGLLIVADIFADRDGRTKQGRNAAPL